MKKTEKYLREMKAVFAGAKDKHEANYQSTNLMAEMSGDAEFFSEILSKHLEKAGNLNTLHYPVVGIDIERHIRQMIAHEKRIVRRDRAVIEDGKRRLQLRRPAGQADHRPLLRISYQRPFAIVEG